MQGAQVWSLVRELTCHMLRGMPKNKNNQLLSGAEQVVGVLFTLSLGPRAWGVSTGGRNEDHHSGHILRVFVPHSPWTYYIYHTLLYSHCAKRVRFCPFYRCGNWGSEAEQPPCTACKKQNFRLKPGQLCTKSRGYFFHTMLPFFWGI